MKRIVFVMMLAMIVSVSQAQRDGVAPLAKGDIQVNFGTGFSSNGLPVYASVDFAIHKDVTLTPEVHVKIGDNFKGGVMFKADYHWNYLIGIPNNWDFYAGARAGFDFGDNDFIPDVGIQVGGRWYWSEKWGMNLEIGGGTGFSTTFGLSVRF